MCHRQGWGMAGNLLFPPKCGPNFVWRIPFLVLSLPLPHFPLISFSTVPLTGSQLRSLPTTWDPPFLSSSQKPFVAEQRLPFHALRSLIHLSAPPSPLLNFLRLPQTSSCPLPLAWTKLLIPCYSIFLVLSWIFSYSFSIFPGFCNFFLLEDIYTSHS